MTSSKARAEIRGARDLAALWRDLPAAVLAYPALTGAPAQGLATLSDTLRAWAWRDHCASISVASCAERQKICSQPGRCHADTLFPMHLGGGAPSWRMATLFVQWRPQQAQWHLVALGQPACASLGWAARCLYEQHGLDGATPLAVTTLGDLALPDARRWALHFVTPWVVSKGADAGVIPDTDRLAHELRKALRQRAYKLSALCLEDARSQRLVGHLVHYVAHALLSKGLQVEQAEVAVYPLELASRGSGTQFVAYTWTGHVQLTVDAAVLPWLSLLAVCGGGENADKGFGGIELRALD